MRTVCLSSKGQVVIPKDIRLALALKQGDRLEVTVDGKAIILRPVEDKASDKLFGRLKGSGLIAELERQHRRELKNELE